MPPFRRNGAIAGLLNILPRQVYRPGQTVDERRRLGGKGGSGTATSNHLLVATASWQLAAADEEATSCLDVHFLHTLRTLPGALHTPRGHPGRGPRQSNQPNPVRNPHQPTIASLTPFTRIRP